MDEEIIAPARTAHTTRCDGFVRLPGELRNYIYRMLLRTDYVLHKGTYPSWKDSFSFELAILRLNKHVHKEASEVFYEDNMWITLHSDPITLGELAGRIAWPFLAVAATPGFDVIKTSVLSISLRKAGLLVPSPFSTAILTVENLDNFIHCLLRAEMWSVVRTRHSTLCKMRLGLEVTSSGIHSRPILQRRILEPFRKLRGLGWIRIHGSVERFYQMKLRGDISTGFRMLSEAIPFAEEYSTKGNEALAAGFAMLASYEFRNALDFMVYAKHVIDRDDRDSAIVQDRRDRIAWGALTFALMFNIAQAHIKLEEFQVAIDFLARDLSAPNTFRNDKRAELYRCIGHAYNGPVDDINAAVTFSWIAFVSSGDPRVVLEL
ncbi:hypothetical protein MMC24_006974 [Lignoscripta atroalba]|nr:hypothetical protein [Lignoscripta atroalba]